MIIRDMISEDIPELAGLMATTSTWIRYGTTLESASNTLQSLLEQAKNPDACECIVAENDGEAVGFIVLQHGAMFGMSSYVKLVGVRQDTRGQGCGSMLMEAAEHSALSRGPNVFLLTSDFNQQAIRFYENLGYQRVGAIKDYVVSGIDEILYRKTRGPLRT
jgi:ribosomal protein S18 acetylase RimI-like enzyme